MAADGSTNPQTAQALFVTLNTVETHLRYTYRKLGIGSREALPSALEDRRDDLQDREYDVLKNMGVVVDERVTSFAVVFPWASG